MSSSPSRLHRRSRTGLRLAGGFEDAWSSYLTALEANPLLVKSVTAGVILGAADLSGQAIQRAMITPSSKGDDAIVGGLDANGEEAKLG